MFLLILVPQTFLTLALQMFLHISTPPQSLLPKVGDCEHAQEEISLQDVPPEAGPSQPHDGKEKASLPEPDHNEEWDDNIHTELRLKSHRRRQGRQQDRESPPHMSRNHYATTSDIANIVDAFRTLSLNITNLQNTVLQMQQQPNVQTTDMTLPSYNSAVPFAHVPAPVVQPSLHNTAGLGVLLAAPTYTPPYIPYNSSPPFLPQSLTQNDVQTSPSLLEEFWFLFCTLFTFYNYDTDPTRA
ncbi:hypothetical protein PM082_022107 [Marasmius tenuissimus]|nr:hypothetical protein PM082_022107 [Marasmius tenuissimus]